MPSQRTRTALFSERRRKDLADAVIAARRFAGWDTTTELIRAVGRGPRAIYALESAEPTVGEVILSAVGRTLGTRVAGWTEDTPRLILEGAPPPPLIRVAEDNATASPGAAPAEGELSDADKVRLDLMKGMIDEIKTEVTWELVMYALGKAGLPVTRANFYAFLAELKQQSAGDAHVADRNMSEQVTPGERS